MKLFELYDKVKYTGLDFNIDPDREYIISKVTCRWDSQPVPPTPKYSIYSRPAPTMAVNHAAPSTTTVIVASVSHDNIPHHHLAMIGGDDIDLDGALNPDLLDEFEKMLNDDDECGLEFCSDFLNDNETPPPTPETTKKNPKEITIKAREAKI